MIPKIEISYSNVYDIVLSKGRKGFDHKRRTEGEKAAKELQKFWDKHSKKILSSISEITKLKWPKKYIECNVSFSAFYSFYQPLTISIDEDINCEFVDLIHELCHVILFGNKNKVKWPESETDIYVKYKDESYNTKLHFLVHSIVISVMEKVFGKEAEKYLAYERWWEKWPDDKMAGDYKISWNIVEKEGSESIIRKLILPSA